MNSKTNSSVHMNDPTTTYIRSLISNIHTHTNIHINAGGGATIYIYIYICIYIYIYIYMVPPPCTHAFLLNLSFGKVRVLGMPLHPHLPHCRMAWVLGLGEGDPYRVFCKVV